MVKKKSVKKSKKNQQKQTFWVSIKSLSLLKKLIILAVALYVGFIAYNVGVDRYNVSLLNKAEAKMSQLDFPGGKKGEIERYCSEKSVKFGSPGKPTCGVGMSLRYVDTMNYAQIFSSLYKTGSNVKYDNKNTSYSFYTVENFQDNLNCNLSLKTTARVLETDTLYLYCQKKFQSKLYPIRD